MATGQNMPARSFFRCPDSIFGCVRECSVPKTRFQHGDNIAKLPAVMDNYHINTLQDIIGGTI